MTDFLMFIAEFTAAMVVAVAIERIGGWIGRLRSGGSGGGGGGMEPWRLGPMPPRPGPHGRVAKRPSPSGPQGRPATDERHHAAH